MASPDPLELLATGDADALRAGLAADPAAARARDAEGVSLLMRAAYRQDPALVAAVREHLGDPDVFEAAALGEVDALRAHLDADAEARGARHADGFQPLHLAAFFGRPAAVELLLARGADPAAVAPGSELRPLNCAVAGGELACVEPLLAAGVDVDAPQRGGVTPLMGAAAAGRLGLVERLLAAGADPTRRSDHGTAAELAEARGHPEVARRLGDG